MSSVEITGVLYDIFRPKNCGDFFLGKIHPVRDGEVSLAESISITGSAEEDELKPQMAYRWYGKFDNHPKYGQQFKVDTFTMAKPLGRTGVIKYLVECPHIGESTAVQLWNKWASDAVRIAREHPEIIAEHVSRLSREKCDEISEYLRSLSALENTSIELLDLLSGRGFPKSMARQIVKRWGNRGVEVISKDPYKLMAFRGGGYMRCDSMYIDLGLPPDRMKRQVCAAWYCIANERDGSVWFPRTKVDQYLRAKIAGTNVQPDKAIAIAKRAGAIDTIRYCAKCEGTGTAMVPDLFFGDELVPGCCPSCGGNGGPLWIAEEKLSRAERYVASHLAQAEIETHPQIITEYATTEKRTITIPTHTRCTRCHRKLTASTVAILNKSPYGPDCITRVAGGAAAEHLPLADWLAQHPTVTVERRSRAIAEHEVQFLNAWPSPDDLHGVSDHQRDEYSKATTGRIGVLCGSPGTGKTYLVAAMVKAIIRQHGIDSVAICAPTGKAAVRCTEVMQSHGVEVAATTIHRLLEVEQADDGDGWMFRHRENNPLPYQFIIVDETSMVDTVLMASLLRARARGTHVLFVGDVNQLPPVGAGAPLRDFIAGRVPTGELREIHRNAGTIVRACAAIRDKKPIPLDSAIVLDSETPKNLAMVTATKTEMIPAIDRTLTMLFENGESLWDVQILVAVNKTSPMSRKKMNEWLQERLNPHGKSVAGSPFRVNDRVICVKNSFFKSTSSDSQVFIANGDMGRVVEVEIRQTIIEFHSPTRRVRVPRVPEKPTKAEANNPANANEKEDDSTGTGCDIDLAFAITCHKSQGSQFKSVIVILDEYPGATGPYGVCDAHWALTAISRAQEKCFLIGNSSTLRSICAKRSTQARKTFLRERIEAFRREFSKPLLNGVTQCQEESAAATAMA